MINRLITLLKILQPILENIKSHIKSGTEYFLKTTLQISGWFINKLIDQYLIFQYHTCDTENRMLLPSKNIYFTLLVISGIFDKWLLIIIYVGLMYFALLTVLLGKIFPKSIGVPFTGFYKKYASPDIFERYCGNPYSAIPGSLAKIATSGGGRIAVATGVTILGQDALHKSGVGQYTKYEFEVWENGGTHPSKKPFLFKPTDPSWADNLSKWGQKK